MTVNIQQLTKEEVAGLISKKIAPNLSSYGLKMFKKAMLPTTVIWGGSVDGEVKCIWGLVPPTLISNEAYLWLQIIEPIEGYEFVFVRHSQRAIEQALDRFPRIVGHCEAGADRSIRWIRWLGGVFKESADGKLLPFVIRKSE